MFEHVVVGWDGSGPASEALRWAAERPGLRELELVRVHDDVDVAVDWEVTGGTEDGVRAVLARQVEALSREFPHLRVTGSVIVGTRAAVLQEHSGSETLLVLGTQPRTGPKVRFRFSLAARLAGIAPGPIAVIPQGYSAGAGPVVVGIDGSPGSRAAAALAADEASVRSAELVVVHAWSEVLDWDLLLPFDWRALPEYSDAHRHILDGVVETVQTEHPMLAVQPMLVRDRPVQALLRLAADASLLVLGKHAKDADPAGPPGSVTHAALLGITVPTMVAGRPQFSRDDRLVRR